MNILTDAFIPVRWDDGTVREVGIAEVLLSADRITELADPSPLAVVAQLRLLLALAIRVFPLEVDLDWLDLYAKERFDAETLNIYFDQQRNRFELFGNVRFGQVDSLKTDKASPLSKLVPELTSGNNAILFDHTDDHSERAYTPAEALRMLLVVQSFGLGGLLKARGTVFGVSFTHPNTTDSAIARGVTVWLAGDTLFETLMLNRVPGETSLQDKPSWEVECDEAYFGRKTTRGLLDRYTALSRMVRLNSEIDPETGKTVVRRMYFTQGRAFDKAEMDPMQCYRAIEKIGYRPLLLGEEKATWRDLTALLQMSRTSGVRAEALSFIGRLWSNGELGRGNVRLHVAGMSSDKAKVNLWRHDRVNLPTAFLADEQLVADLAALLGEAETAAVQVWARTKALCRHFLSPVKGMMQPDPNNVAALADQLDPRRTFWARLETHLTNLLEEMPLPDKADAARAAWRDAIEASFQEAIRSAKELLGPSPRAWRAAADVSDFYTVKGSTYDGNSGSDGSSRGGGSAAAAGIRSH